MTDTRTTLQAIIDQTVAANLDPLRSFLFSNPSEPLIATGSGGAETAGEFAALLYGARGGVATSMTPYTFNSYSPPDAHSKSPPTRRRPSTSRTPTGTKPASSS